MDDKALAAKLNALGEALGTKAGYDEEPMHQDADNLLCEALLQLGYSEAVAAFRALPKWYA